MSNDGRLSQASFEASPPTLRRSFDTYMTDKIRGFVGRQFVFEAVHDFIRTRSSGYFVIRGDPGIGKTALLAKLISAQGYIHHFNIALQNIRSVRSFLENVCLQLIARYHLPYQTLPQNATMDGGFFLQCLSEAAARHENRPVVIAIDALDEAERTGLSAGVNTLCLPYALPEGSFILLTSRRQVDMHLQVAHSQTLDLEADSAGNIRDIREYIEQFSQRPTMLTRISAWKTDVKAFSDALARKSQGNFMYLHYVLPAIEAGRFVDGKLDELPEGLLGYYQRHWRQMREGNEQTFDQLFEPIVCILGVAQEPITEAQMSNWTRLDRGQVRQALEKWHEFLLVSRQGQQTFYRIYHASFQDFLSSRVDLTKYDGMIAEYYMRLTRME